MSTIHLATAPFAMFLPKIDPKASAGNKIKFDPMSRLGESLGKSGAYALTALASLGILTGRASALAIRRLTAL